MQFDTVELVEISYSVAHVGYGCIRDAVASGDPFVLTQAISVKFAQVAMSFR